MAVNPFTPELRPLSLSGEFPLQQSMRAPGDVVWTQDASQIVSQDEKTFLNAMAPTGLPASQYESFSDCDTEEARFHQKSWYFANKSGNLGNLSGTSNMGPQFSSPGGGGPLGTSVNLAMFQDPGYHRNAPSHSRQHHGHAQPQPARPPAAAASGPSPLLRVTPAKDRERDRGRGDGSITLSQIRKPRAFVALNPTPAPHALVQKQSNYFSDFVSDPNNSGNKENRDGGRPNLQASHTAHSARNGGPNAQATGKSKQSNGGRNRSNGGSGKNGDNSESKAGKIAQPITFALGFGPGNAAAAEDASNARGNNQGSRGASGPSSVATERPSDEHGNGSEEKEKSKSIPKLESNGDLSFFRFRTKEPNARREDRSQPFRAMLQSMNAANSGDNRTTNNALTPMRHVGNCTSAASSAPSSVPLSFSKICRNRNGNHFELTVNDRENEFDNESVVSKVNLLSEFQMSVASAVSTTSRLPFAFESNVNDTHKPMSANPQRQQGIGSIDEFNSPERKRRRRDNGGNALTGNKSVLSTLERRRSFPGNLSQLKLSTGKKSRVSMAMTPYAMGTAKAAPLATTGATADKAGNIGNSVSLPVVTVFLSKIHKYHIFIAIELNAEASIPMSKLEKDCRQLYCTFGTEMSKHKEELSIESNLFHFSAKERLCQMYLQLDLFRSDLEFFRTWAQLFRRLGGKMIEWWEDDTVIKDLHLSEYIPKHERNST